jgi:hypothetical protein
MPDQVTFCSDLIRFESFAPMTRENYVEYYINGYEYFSDVYDAFESASVEIYITDWMFSPELPLKRPLSKYPDSR